MSEVSELKDAWSREMPDELRWILGRPNFACGPIAHIFQAAGRDIKKRAEDEQAFVIYWMIGLWIKHGADWRDVAEAEIQDLKAEIKQGKPAS